MWEVSRSIFRKTILMSNGKIYKSIEEIFMLSNLPVTFNWFYKSLDSIIHN